METTPTSEFKLQLVFIAHVPRDRLKSGLQPVFQTPRQIIDARRGVSAFDVLGMEGNLINNRIRARSNADESSLSDSVGIGEVAVDLVSGLLEFMVELLL